MTHDALLMDLDGTVYRGTAPVDGAVEALEKARARGVRLAYVTNNASRAPEAVAAHLVDLGLTAGVDDVVTSAQAGAAVLADLCPSGARVLVLGTEALADEIRAVGLDPVRHADDEPVAVVQGHSPETGWAQLAEATVAVGSGATWVACNVDPTLPHERGLLPGNGAMVAALRTATGREPTIAGKPAAPLLRQSVERVAARRPLVVGDRLDTDVEGAHAIDAESLLVLTGVSTASDLLVAAPGRRPTYVAGSLDALEDLDAVRVGDDGGWDVTAEPGSDTVTLVLGGAGGDAVGALRALCAAGWAAGAGDALASAAVRGEGGRARDVIATLGLPRA